MAIYDRKLGDWFKEVEQLAQELREKKQQRSVSLPDRTTQSSGEGITSEATTVLPTGVMDSTPTAKVGIQHLPLQHARADRDANSVAVAEKSENDGDTSARPEAVAGLFEEDEIPQVEDFLPFLDRSDKPDQQAPRKSEAADSYTDAQQPLLNLSEGTGVPRPIRAQVDGEKQSAQVSTDLLEQRAEQLPNAAPTSTESERTSAVSAEIPKHMQRVTTEPEQPRESSAEEKWARVPSHLRALFEEEVPEVAQRSYKTFKESRAELIERLLDPIITLEDAARILNVCPTTVRRYTNKGILRHFRTPGNQRRFKLSDVIAFLESRRTGQGRGKTKELENSA